jgi:hypothetical protein
VGHEVDGLGRVPNEDNLSGRFRVDEIGDHVPSRLVLGRRLLREVIHAAMNVGVGFPVIPIDRGNDTFRFLGARRTIEENEPATVRASFGQDRKLVSDLNPVDRFTCACRNHGRSPLGDLELRNSLPEH